MRCFLVHSESSASIAGGEGGARGVAGIELASDAFTFSAGNGGKKALLLFRWASLPNASSFPILQEDLEETLYAEQHSQPFERKWHTQPNGDIVRKQLCVFSFLMWLLPAAVTWNWGHGYAKQKWTLIFDIYLQLKFE